MCKKVFFLPMLIATFLLTFSLNAQERVIKGTITTLDSILLIGVNIKVQSTKQTVLSDSLGNFSVKCNTKDKLMVTARGFSKQRVRLKGNIKFVTINLILRPYKENSGYDIGFGHISKKDIFNMEKAKDK